MKFNVVYLGMAGLGFWLGCLAVKGTILIAKEAVREVVISYL